MEKIDKILYNVGYLDRLSYLDTVLHRVDPRAKLLTTIIFIFMIVSYGKYEISGLLSFFIFPVILMSVGCVPFMYLLKKLLIVSPFAIFIGIFNPYFDRDIILSIGSMDISGGWISFTSIMLRFILAVSAALILIATTGFNRVCLALEKLKVPRIFAVQLLFLYRYIFVLIDETLRLVRARSMRSFHRRGMGMKVAGSMIAQLLLRTINRAKRIYLSMLSRGFDGEIRILKTLRFRFKDFLYIACWAMLFLFFRFNNLPRALGKLITG